MAAGIYAGPGRRTGIDTMREVVVATVFVVIEDAAPRPGWTPSWGPGLVEVSGMLQRFEEEAFALHLYVSNQSSTINPVAVRITLDGEVVVDQEFEYLDGHNWILFELQVAPGEHALHAVAPEVGVELRETFEMDGERWAVVDFWAEPVGHGPAPASPG